MRLHKLASPAGTSYCSPRSVTMAIPETINANMRKTMEGMTPLWYSWPQLADRKPMPPHYQPLIFVLTIVPFFFPSRRRIAICMFPLILDLCLRSPCYTFGNPSADYYNSSFFIAVPLWFLEFAILAPQKGSGAPAYIGNPKRSDTRSSRTLDGMYLSWQKVLRVCLLMVPSHRGIGWNWQVKGVLDDPYEDLSKRAFVGRHIQKMMIAYLRSMAMLMLLGWGSAAEVRLSFEARPYHRMVDALIGWSGAIWVWDRLNFAYSFIAAVSVGSGVCETWQWPPLMGKLRDAWSVRQVWSVVYHQTMRKVKSGLTPHSTFTSFPSFPPPCGMRASLTQMSIADGLATRSSHCAPPGSPQRQSRIGINSTLCVFRDQLLSARVPNVYGNA